MNKEQLYNKYGKAQLHRENIIRQLQTVEDEMNKIRNQLNILLAKEQTNAEIAVQESTEK